MGLRFWRRVPRVDRAVRRGDVRALLRVLAHRDLVAERDGQLVDIAAANRRRAVEALAGIPEDAAREGLAGALEDPAPTVRQAAVQALAGRGESAAYETLATAAAESGHADTRAWAVEALGEHADRPPEVTVALARRLLAPEGWGDDGLAQRAAAVVAAAGLQAETREEVVGLAIAALVHEDEGVRDRARLCLLAAGPATSGPRLVAALDERPGRAQVLEALGELHDSATLAAIERHAADEDPDVRRAVAAALGRLKDPRGLNALVALSADPEYAVREVAIAVLNEFGTVAVIWGIAGATAPQMLDPMKSLLLGSGEERAEEAGEAAG